MNKPLYALFCLFFATISYTYCQDSDDNSLLWQIEGEGMEKPSFLFGTIHAICEEAFFLPDGLEESLKASDKLVLELDMDDPAMTMALMQGSLMKDTTLRDLMKPEAYQEFRQKLRTRYGIELDMVNKMKPIMLSTLLISRSANCETISYEQKLLEMVQQSGKEIGGIEKVQEQVAIFDSIPYSKQLEILKEMIDQPEEYEKMYGEMVEKYQTADLEELQSFMSENMAEYQAFEDALLIERNLRWIPRMEQMMLQSPVFFAVGAGHLGGEQGVINLLREAGYRVEPVKVTH